MLIYFYYQNLAFHLISILYYCNYKLHLIVFIKFLNHNHFILNNNYPNPFNPLTRIRYYIPENGLVNIMVYDMLGNKVNQLVNEIQISGYNSVIWDATNNQGNSVSAGVYLYSIEAEIFRQTKKMILLK